MDDVGTFPVRDSVIELILGQTWRYGSTTTAGRRLKGETYFMKVQFPALPKSKHFVFYKQCKFMSGKHAKQYTFSRSANCFNMDKF